MADNDIVLNILTHMDEKSFKDGMKNMTNSVNKLTNTIKGFGDIWLGLMMGQTMFNSILSIFSQFNLMWSSMGKGVMDLSWAFGELQGAWANLLATAIEPMIPYIIQIIHWLTAFIQYMTVIIAALFGMKQTIGSIVRNTDALAGFDKINRLSAQIVPPVSPPPIIVPPELLAAIDALKKSVAELVDPLLKEFLKAWNTWGDWIKSNPALFTTLVIAIAAVALVLWLVLTPLGLITLLIIGLIALAVLLTNNWNTLGTTIQQLGAVWWYALTHPFEGLHDAVMAAMIVITVVVAAIIALIAGVPLAIVAAIMLVITGIGLLIIHFASIKDFFKGLANDIIGFFNSVARASAATLNSIIDGMNAINSINPLAPKMSHVSAVQIPYLATGAVIQPNAPFMAMLGDQSNGRNIEAPESLLRQIVREEIGNQSIIINASGEAGLIKYLKLQIEKENIRVGQSMVKRTGNPVLS